MVEFAFDPRIHRKWIIEILSVYHRNLLAHRPKRLLLSMLFDISKINSNNKQPHPFRRIPNRMDITMVIIKRISPWSVNKYPLQIKTPNPYDSSFSREKNSLFLSLFLIRSFCTHENWIDKYFLHSFVLIKYIYRVSLTWINRRTFFGFITKS